MRQKDLAQHCDLTAGEFGRKTSSSVFCYITFCLKSIQFNNKYTMKQRKLTESEIAAFNVFRESHVSKRFKRDEMRKTLKDLCGLPGSDQFLMCITQGVNPPILKTERGVYTVNPKPVYKSRLEEVFRVYREMIHKEGVRNVKKISIEDAIYVLKNAGYKVLKPTTQYEEV